MNELRQNLKRINEAEEAAGHPRNHDYGICVGEHHVRTSKR